MAFAYDPAIAEALRCPESILPASIAAQRRWIRTIPSAWQDAQDGTLSGNPVAAYLSDSAQRTPIAIDSSGRGQARLLIAFGSTARESRKSLEDARTLSAAAFVQRDHDRWASKPVASLSGSSPRFDSAADRDRILLAARRALLHIYNGTDRSTAPSLPPSLAKSPMARLATGRSLLRLRLDVAGDPDAVSQRLAWPCPSPPRCIGPGQLIWSWTLHPLSILVTVCRNTPRQPGKQTTTPTARSAPSSASRLTIPP